MQLMDNWKLVLTFNFIEEARNVKHKLESEQIVVILKDGFETRVDNIVSKDINIIKLLVSVKDFHRATLILQSEGYLKKDLSVSNVGFRTYFENFTERIPIIGNWIFELRAIISLAILIAVIAVPTIIATKPTLSEKLTSQGWCIDSFDYKGVKYHTNTLGLKIVIENGCTETFHFLNDGRLNLPGFNSNSVLAKWKLDNDKVVIFDSDTLAYIYDGDYSLILSPTSIVLKSTSTTLQGHSNRSNFFYQKEFLLQN